MGVVTVSKGVLLGHCSLPTATAPAHAVWVANQAECRYPGELIAWDSCLLSLPLLCCFSKMELFNPIFKYMGLWISSVPRTIVSKLVGFWLKGRQYTSGLIFAQSPCSPTFSWGVWPDLATSQQMHVLLIQCCRAGTAVRTPRSFPVVHTRVSVKACCSAGLAFYFSSGSQAQAVCCFVISSWFLLTYHCVRSKASAPWWALIGDCESFQSSVSAVSFCTWVSKASFTL